MAEHSPELLTKIYIGQNIRDDGILQFSISDIKNEVKVLIEKGLVRENHWYSHALYLTTSRGAEIARSLIEKKIDACRDEIRNFLAGFPPRLVGFIINDYFAKSLDFAEYLPEYYYGEYWLDDWKKHILRDPKIWTRRTEILSKLEDLGLCVRTNYYVSTRGGTVQESRYVISPEVRELLFDVSPPYGLTEEENKNCRVYHFLREIVNWLDHPVVDEVRQRYLDEMQRMNVDEADIKEVIDKLAEKGITDPYLGIAREDRKPYSIKDKTRYSFFIQNFLIKPIVTDLQEGRPKLVAEREGYDQTQILQHVIKLVEAAVLHN